MFRSIAFAVTFLAVMAVESLACTTFCLKNKNEVLFGKNYDWMIGDGAVFVNRRGVSKFASVEGEKDVAKWTSKYGSVTFNQYGRESPSGGMNEAGLVIELMWLDDTKYPAADKRPAISVLEWIQYNLDTAGTTVEVIANSGTVRIASRVNLHYLVNDRQGNAATIEFLDGKLVVHTGKNLPVAALANDTYARSLSYFQTMPPAKSESSLDRFARASTRAMEFNSRTLAEKEAVDHAFSILAEVAQKNSTQWSIVYDQTRGKIYFRTRRAPEVKMIDTTAFDYSCAAPVKMLDMNTGNTGNVSHLFSTYTRAANRDLIERSFSGTDFLKGIPPAAKDQIAAFPERFGCGENLPLVRPEPKQIATAVAGLTVRDIVFPIYFLYKTSAWA